MDSYSQFLMSQFVRYFLLVFAVLLALASAWLYFNPKAYWGYFKKTLKFKGVSGAKPTKRFYRWVQISALVQITLSAAILFVLFVLR